MWLFQISSFYLWTERIPWPVITTPSNSAYIFFGCSRSAWIRPTTEGGEPDLLSLLAFSSNFLFLSSSSSSLSLLFFAL